MFVTISILLVVLMFVTISILLVGQSFGRGKIKD